MPIQLTAKQANALVGNTKPAQKRARKRVQFNVTTEAEIQALIVAWLEYAGYIVSVIGQYFESQRKVNAVGYPDLSVRHPRYPRGMAVLLECKRPKIGKMSKPQQEFFDQGGSFVVHSLEEAQAALQTFESSWTLK